MENFEWKNIYSVGNPKIDSQHKKLFEIASHFQQAYLEQKDKPALGEIFDELLDYTKFHFKDEEELMKKCSYPDIESHMQKHKQLIDLVLELKKSFDAGNEGVEKQILSFLKTWLSGHILGVDTRYRGYVNA